jgi:hypothetical protein
MRLLPSAQVRSLVGLVIAAAFAPFLLVLMACLPVPIGDPEKSRIDPELSGVWLVPADRDSQGELWLLEPYDARTWLVSVVQTSADKAPAQAGSAATSPAIGLARLERDDAQLQLDLFKGWLTTIKSARFLVLEPKLSVDAESGMKPTLWLAFRIALPAPETLELRLVNSEHPELKNVETTQQAESVIGRHLEDPKLYDDARSLTRVAQSDYRRVRDLLKRVTNAKH